MAVRVTIFPSGNTCLRSLCCFLSRFPLRTTDGYVCVRADMPPFSAIVKDQRYVVVRLRQGTVILALASDTYFR